MHGAPASPISLYGLTMSLSTPRQRAPKCLGAYSRTDAPAAVLQQLIAGWVGRILPMIAVEGQLLCNRRN